MSGPLGIYYGQFVTDATSRTLTINAQALTLNVGSWYLHGYTGESAVQFCEHLQAKIRTAEGQSNALVEYSPTSDRVTITLGTEKNITFTNVAIANFIGFQNGAVQPSSLIHVGSGHPRYVWRPTRAVADVPVDTNVVWQQRSATVSGRSVDGTTYTVPSGTVYDAVIQYRCLPQDEAITPAGGTVYLDFQQWFADVPCAGRPFRYVMNREKYGATGDFVTAVWGEEGADEVGAFRDAASRRIESYQGRWDVRIPMLKKV